MSINGKKLLDSDTSTITANSSFPMYFTLCKDLKSPKKYKIEVLGTRLKYNISKVENELSINVKYVDLSKCSLHDCINIKDVLIYQKITIIKSYLVL